MKTAAIDYENNLYAQGFFNVGGMDEVGRGPLAGPVTACVVILPQNLQIQGVYDSKTLSSKKREELAGIIKESAIDYALGWADAALIDEINILQATYVAMSRALEGLNTPLDALLIDGLKGKWIPKKHCMFIKRGDSASHSIAAASILAKVARDALMQEWHSKYPQYGFDTNKGYGSVKHIEAIRTYGLCPLHRRSFLTKIIGAK
ncbi:MAG: ribonuclease HII [Defluviitaleaceae bacterium]|nr:ribonuclease HII [Defluviitaleaceae bacterium]